MEKKDMTVQEFANQIERTYETVIRWLNAGMVPGAYKEQVTDTLSIWRIPEAALEMPLPKSGPKSGEKKTAKKKGARAK